MATRKWKTELLVNTTTLFDQDDAAVTALADGGFAVAWRDDTQPESVVRFQRYDALGAKVGGELPADNISGDQSSPSIVQLDGGNLWIVQQDFDGMADQDAEGAVFSLGGAFIRNQDVGVSVQNEIEQALASLGGFGAAAVWTNTSIGGSDIQMNLYDSLGIGGAATVVNGGASQPQIQNSPDIAANAIGSRFAVVWRDVGLGNDIRGRVFDNAGVEIGAEFTVNAAAAGDRFVPKVAWLDNQRFAVAWESLEASPAPDALGAGIRYAVYTTSGGAAVPLGGERQANSTIIGNQTVPAITALKDGGFAIAWQDESLTGGDNDFFAIRLQVFDGAGDKRGGEILVNTTTVGSQLDVDLATLADGRIIVTWSDSGATGGDTSGAAVRAQIVDPRDGIVDGTAGADTLYGHDSVGDIISGYDGIDTLIGLAGDDTISGGAGNDTLNGGKGDDVLFGGAQDDSLRGWAGDDDLFGEEGFDTLEGGAGADNIDGGAGSNDTASYLAALAAVTVSLDGTLTATGDAAGDVFSGIERLQGSNLGGDTLRGNEFANVITGFGGADTINAALGNDRLAGSAGIDTLTGGTGLDRFEYNAQSEGGDIVTDFIAADDTFAFRGSAFGGLAAGGIAGAQFVARADNVAQDANDFFIFRTTDKTLWFDVNGAGGTGPVMIADMQATATMTSSDIVIF